MILSKLGEDFVVHVKERVKMLTTMKSPRIVILVQLAPKSRVKDPKLMYNS